MRSNIVYLDNAATTKPYDEVITCMKTIEHDHYGNPSSSHSMGLDAEKIIKDAGDFLGSSLGVKRENLVFTSGGTESDNMALMQPFFDINKIENKGLIMSKTEHPAVNSTGDYLENQGIEVKRLPVDGYGVTDLDSLRRSIDVNTAIISIMYVNNEVGTIQPVRDICSIKSEASLKYNRDLKYHTDAVQAYGKFPIDLNKDELAGIDLMTVSAHKIHGSKGVGALYIRNPNKIMPFIRGGGQERGFRSGTENVAGISGFGCAAGIQFNDLKTKMKKVAELRKRLLEALLDNIKDIVINSPIDASLEGEPGKCVPTILSASFLGTKGEVILHSLEQSGIYVSTESACSSKKRAKSPVLSAMGKSSEEIEGTIRFSLSVFNTVEEIDYAVAETKKAVEKFRKLTGYKRK